MITDQPVNTIGSFTQRFKKKERAQFSPRPRGWSQFSADIRQLDTVAMIGTASGSIAYAGALRALHEAKLLDSVTRFTGNSSGSLLALVSALGYRGKALEKVVIEQDPSEFFTISLGWVTQLPASFRRYGIFTGQGIRRSCEMTCATRIGKPDITFAELDEYHQRAQQNDRAFFEAKYNLAMKQKRKFQRRKEDFTFDFERETVGASIDAMMEIAKSFRRLEITGTELTRKKDGIRAYKNVIFDKENWPDLSLAMAVRTSASYPFIFRNAKLKNQADVTRSYTDGVLSGILPLKGANESKTVPDGTLCLYTPFAKDIESEIESGSNFFFKRLRAMLVRYMGAKEIEKRGLEDISPYQAGKNFLNEVNDHFEQHAKDVFSHPEVTSHILTLERKTPGRKVDNFKISRDEKRDLISQAYHTTWENIERLTHMKKPALAKETIGVGR